MKWTTIAENWSAYVPRLLTRWPDLKEDTLLSTDGNRALVTAHLAETQQTDAASADTALAEWMRGAEPADAMMDASRDNARILASGADIPAGEDAFDDDAKFGDDNTVDTPIGRS